MTSEIEEEAQRLNEKLQYWADTLDLPMDDINADAASWFEYVTKSDDPLITEFTDFVDEKVALHTPDYPIMVLIFLTAAAMSLLSYRKVNRPEQPDWISLIRAAEQLAMLEGLVSSTVLEREARSRKLSQGGKRGAQVKHEGVSKLNRPGFCRQSRASYFLSNRSPYEQSTLPRRIQDRGGQTNP